MLSIMGVHTDTQLQICKLPTDVRKAERQSPVQGDIRPEKGSISSTTDAKDASLGILGNTRQSLSAGI